MESPAANDAAKPDPGLPPVQPPSGRFIAQLFVVPGLIILVVVLVVMGFSYYGKHTRDPSHFLQQLDSDNPDIRWRGASDLAQILKRPEPATLRWKADPKFALDLAERLDLAFERLVQEEKAIAAQYAASTDKDKHLLWRKLRNDRDHISYLGAALGEFYAPVGAPILCKILKHENSADINGNTQQRRLALWALINMGDNLKGFAKVPAEQQAEMIAALKEEAAKTGARASWARTGLYYLDKNALTGNAQDIVKVDETLVRLADADDQFLRKLVALSFNFWDGDQAEATLLKLANDKGGGTLLRIEEND
jgi:hypothetical protein